MVPITVIMQDNFLSLNNIAQYSMLVIKRNWKLHVMLLTVKCS